MLLKVTLLTPEKVLFEDDASSVILPGEEGTCEILPFHKAFLSRLVSGTLTIDNRAFHIRRGAVKVNQNRVMIIVEDR